MEGSGGGKRQLSFQVEFLAVTQTLSHCIPGAAEACGGGAAGEVGDGSGRVGRQLQRGPEAAGVSGQSRTEKEPHPGDRRGHGQRGPQVGIHNALHDTVGWLSPL